MCLRYQQLDSKSRRIYAAGFFFLLSGILSQAISEDSFVHRHFALFNGVRFLLLGCAIGLLLWFNRRRCHAASPRP